MNESYRKAQQEVGLPLFEHNCRVTWHENRWIKAYKVPGTRQAKQYARLLRKAARLASSYQ